MKRTEPDKAAELFHVAGAGNLSLRLDAVTRCGNASGVALGCSWGEHGYAGGAMDAVEVARLRDALDKWLMNNTSCKPSDLSVALEESLKLQSHYAELLNTYDGGSRIGFASTSEWIARLRECGKLPKLRAILRRKKRKK